MTADTIAGELADFVVSTPYESIPADALHAARRALLDLCGSAIRGSIEPPPRMARAAAATAFGGSGASLFADGAEMSPVGAAFVNGVSSHTIELDDLHNPSTFHPGAPIIPAVLAAAEASGSSGAEVLRAITLGFEVGIRIAEAVNPTHYRYWHPTGTCGAFGAAAGAGVILGLDARQLTHALGSAGTQASGLWAFLVEGAMSKHLHAGRAAANGLVAAFLAREGFTGARSIVESPRGFVVATTDGADPETAVADLGIAPLKILENGFKVHACCGHTHTALDLAIEIGERVPAESIERVQVGTYDAALSVAGIEDPKTGYEGRFSLRYTTALGLLRGHAGLDMFNDDRVHDPDLQDLMQRVDTTIDPDIQSRYPDEWGCRLRVTTADGSELVATAAHPRGMPANPLSDAELEAKYLALTTPVIGDDAAKRVAQRIWSLPDGDARCLFESLSVAGFVR